MEADMRFRVKQFLAPLAVLFLTLPVWAHTESIDLTIDHTVTISGTQLQPGEYSFKVADNAKQVTVIKDGGVVVQAPCHWIQLPSKPDASEIKSSENQITEIDFKGRTDAVQLP
jgi:hypothetical protein